MELYIGNIPEGANDYALRRFFGMFGEPATFRVIDRDEGDGHVRYGWADIEDASRARKLIAQ
ncbi:MAG: RNA-binding protein, partial [Gammaproteobacteria bacterium]|nr:RNA-binding protein [Gammaproteobacteria bacterium]NIT64622.1 RNA-binding protein [Gammaproteobacteria bacterium]NIV21187.1 hypothetical protein [Gammaproteobacteria bacterium]NIY33202.1 hypothetical protein [Gammaproteobacteria bacterium]